MKRAVALIADPAQHATVAAVAEHAWVSGVWSPGSKRWCQSPVPICADLAELVAGAPVCCFLTGYRAMAADAAAALHRGVHVLSAGPLGLSAADLEALVAAAGRASASLRCGQLHAYSRAHAALWDQTGRPAFGDLVHLRVATGGGTRFSGWWSVCQALQWAAGLVDAPLTALHVAAMGSSRRRHVAVCGLLGDRTTLQVVATPRRQLDLPDLVVLGTAGTATVDAARVPPLGAGTSLPVPPWLRPEPAWVAGFVTDTAAGPCGVDSRADQVLWLEVLRALDRAVRTRRPVPVRAPLPHRPLSLSP